MAIDIRKGGIYEGMALVNGVTCKVRRRVLAVEPTAKGATNRSVLWKGTNFPDGYVRQGSCNLARFADWAQSEVAPSAPHASGRVVCFVPVDSFVDGHGYRAAIVVEGEKGYSPTGTWPLTGAADEKAPWFFGPTREAAERQAQEFNDKVGISALEAAMIIAGSM